MPCGPPCTRTSTRLPGARRMVWRSFETAKLMPSCAICCMGRRTPEPLRSIASSRAQHAVDREVDLRRHGGDGREVDLSGGRDGSARRHLTELVEDELVHEQQAFSCGLHGGHVVE